MDNSNVFKNIFTKNSEKYNFIIIGIFTFLYILFITKLTDIIIINYDDNDETKIQHYVMTIYLLSIMGLVIGYIWFTKENNANYIVNKSLSIGSIMLLIYIIINYWEYLDDYSKLIMISLSMSFIIYYIYK